MGINQIAKDFNDRQIPTKKGGRLSHGTINGILTNEKYTGDVVFQKTYTDAQFNRHQNNGQKEQYFCYEHHEAIISHEDFELAARLLEQHRIEKGIVKGGDIYQQCYAFSGKIICGECDATFRRRMHSCVGHKYAAWLCNTHLTDTKACSMLYIRNDDLEHAYLTMINKLIFSRKVLLTPLLEQLKSTSEDDGIRRIRELERLLLQIIEQRQTLQCLMAQGYLDQVIFTKQKNELMTQTEACKAEIEILQNSSGQVSTRIAKLQKLLHFTEHSDMLQEFNEELFTEYADHIIVYSREEIGIQLKCGLTLRERM
ncbi:MAG: recombinase family protein [Bacteroidales bacterium]